MHIEQIYTGCLAQGAYYITSNGEAAIIDPLRETEPYIHRLNKDKVQLKYIFETHFHADFVSGHLDLSKATKANIVYGPSANPTFNCIIATDNETFIVGDITIKILHTPGHTLESTCYLLIDETGKAHSLFTGDTLFIGDVGRPDLAQKNELITKEQLAATLYHSLRNKIMTLPDNVIVYPAHGAGSACGKNMSSETTSTIGHQKKNNYALRANMTESEFVNEVIAGLPIPPAYFADNVAMNKYGYDSFNSVFNKGMKPLSVDEFLITLEQTGAIILDTRNHQKFYKGFIPSSINIGLNGDFAPWVGAIIGNTKQPIVLVTPILFEAESITRLSRIGFDNVIGFLEGGYDSWTKANKEIDCINQISATHFSAILNSSTPIIDVRKETEYLVNHVENATNKPLANINSWINTINKKEHFYLHCAGGYRSMIAASILHARGYRNFTEIEGGIKAIKGENLPVNNINCSSE